MPDLKNVLDMLDTGRWVSLAYVKVDRTRGIGGEIVRLPRCRQRVRKQSASPGAGQSATFIASGNPKNPNHSEHGTRNLILPNGQVRKAHYRTIFLFQGQQVF